MNGYVIRKKENRDHEMRDCTKICICKPFHEIEEHVCIICRAKGFFTDEIMMCPNCKHTNHTNIKRASSPEGPEGPSRDQFMKWLHILSAREK